MHDDDKTQSNPLSGWQVGDFPPDSDEASTNPATPAASGTPDEKSAADAAASAPAPVGPDPSSQPAHPTPPAPPAAPVQPAQPWNPWAPQPAPPQNPYGQPRPWPPQPTQPPAWQGGGWGTQPQQPQQPWSPYGQPAQPAQPWQPPAQPLAPQPSSWAPTGSASAASASARPSRLPMLLSVVAACLISFSAGMATDRLVFGSAATATPTPSAIGSNEPLQNFSLYEQALQIVKKNYVGESDITDQQLLYGSIRGMVEALGDTGHSTFLTPEEYKASQSELSGNVAGIGVLLGTDNGQFTVTRVLPGSPAEGAGVKAGDQIVAVDGESVSGMTLDVFSGKVRGPAGTKVTLSVVRAGVADPIDITITRAVVAVPLVTWGIVPGTHVADIALFEFAQGASDQLATAIKSATDAGATSIVLDLRGNPGGYASEAVNVASQFIATGTVYYTEDAKGNRTANDVNTSVEHTSLPVVVLVDHNSASAAEIVSGALQDSHRATLVGEPTFGTGTVLEVFKLSDGSAILLGTAYWLTPDGNKIFGKGIKPDQEVALAAGAAPLNPEDLKTMTAAQYKASADAQLMAAVQDLTK